jgi:glycosyltransferase involved in cell wall biosynthesis
VRVGLIAPPWFPLPPSGYGGAERVVGVLADGLSERGHEVTLFAPPGSRTRARLVSPLRELPPEALVGNAWYEAAHAVVAYEHGADFEIIHDHLAPVGASIGAISGYRVVHTLHAPFTPHVRPLYELIAERLWFVAISESQRLTAPPNLRWGGTVYNGIPVSEYPFREQKDDFLLFLGRTDEEKAPHLAIEAARRAGRRLVLCVSTKIERERIYWEEKIAPLLGDDVEVKGECDQKQKADLLARAAALLFPIQWAEPFGLVMTEAMACGTPVIGWRNGSVPEVVADGETGFVVTTVGEMTAAVERLGELDPHAMRARVQQRFSAEAMVEGYERVYTAALASVGPRKRTSATQPAPPRSKESNAMAIRSFQSPEEATAYARLTQGLKTSPIAESELIANLPLYLDRSALGHVLFMNELYQLILGVHGIIVEFGTRWGRNLALLTELRNLYEPRNAARRIVGFDTFAGFPSIAPEDGAAAGVAVGAYSVAPGYETTLSELMSAHEKFGFRSHIEKFELVKGDVVETLHPYLERHPETVIAMAYFDLDLFTPTSVALELVKERLVSGSVVAFDELGMQDLPGETTAVASAWGLSGLRLRRSPMGQYESYVVIE